MLTSSPHHATRTPRWAGKLFGSQVNHIGIDIGIDTVQVATLGACTDSGDAGVQWSAQSEFSLPIDPQAPAPENWLHSVLDRLRERLPRCVPGNENRAWISLPLPWIHYQTSDAAELDAGRTQCDEMFQASLFRSDAHCVHWAIGPASETFVLAATAREAAMRIAEQVGRNGYLVNGIVPHGAALISTAKTLTSLEPAAVLLLDPAGGLVALRSGSSTGLCRVLPAIRHGDPSAPTMDVLEPWLREVASEVDATMRFAARHGEHVDSDSPILICGRITNCKGVDADLASLLGRPIATWRYAGRNRPANQSSIFDPQTSDSNTAVALSLASYGLIQTETR